MAELLQLPTPEGSYTRKYVEAKGSLISEFFSPWLKSLIKVPNHNLEHYLLKLRENAQDRDLVPLFGNLRQSEKLSEIKPHLMPPTFYAIIF
jgi:hypothetical protein